LQRPTVVASGYPCIAPEDAGQVMLVDKAGRSRNLGQRCTGIAHPFLVISAVHMKSVQNAVLSMRTVQLRFLL
jgi:hypothetical protein